jgi:type IV pilus assembly protein PilA
MTMKFTQKGFTLIELMIVVAIIAILAAIAIPAYQDFLIRSRVTDLNTQAGACKTAVAEFYASRGVFPTLAQSGCATSATENALAPGIGALGQILITAGGPFAVTLAAKGSPLVFALQPQCGVAAAAAANNAACTGADIQRWDCDAAAGTTITPKYLPAICR